MGGVYFVTRMYDGVEKGLMAGLLQERRLRGMIGELLRRQWQRTWDRPLGRGL